MKKLYISIGCLVCLWLFAQPIPFGGSSGSGTATNIADSVSTDHLTSTNIIFNSATSTSAGASGNAIQFGQSGFGTYLYDPNGNGIGIAGTGSMSINVTAFRVGGPATFTNNVVMLGSLTVPIATKVANYPLVSGDNTILLNGTTLTATLPTAVSVAGKVYTIKVISASTGTVATTSSQTIDASTTYSLSAQWKYVTVISDGANWKVIANN